MQGLKPGDMVVTVFTDPGLPEGSCGVVEVVHDDPLGGVDVLFGNGRFNVVASGLELSTSPTAEAN